MPSRRPRYGFDPHYVYQFWEGDRCLYVGMTIRLPLRMQQHTHKPWWPLVTRISAEMVRGRYPAMDLELRLIRELKPVHNVVGLPVPRPNVRISQNGA